MCLVERNKILASETVVSKVYSDDILDTGKSILYYVLYTKNIDTKTQLNDLGISEDKVQEIQELALEQMKFVNETKYLFKDKVSDIEVGRYNNIIFNNSYEIKKELKDILGKDYTMFISWLSESWEIISECRRVSLLDGDSSDDCDIEVYATQFEIDDYCVALPDMYLKFANLGWDDEYENPIYTVDVISYNRGTEVDNVPVNDVGPWNESDDYWNINRRLFSDLELSLPEAEAAYFDNYNDGCDEFGRIVSNPAGIDLSPEVASDLGFGEYESGWISIHLNF